MSKDRFKELASKASPINVTYQSLPQQEENPPTVIQIDRSLIVLDFLQEIDSIRLMIDQIDEYIDEVQRIHIKMLQPSVDQRLQQELDEKTEKIRRMSYEIAARLKKLEQVQESEDPIERSRAQWRIKESQIFVLTRRLRDSMCDYNQKMDQHREQCKRIIVRELEIAGNRKSSDELEEILENNSSGVWNFSILIETQREKQSLEQIEARHHDILKLEQSIKELHNMFCDLAILVADQGHMIDSIEHNVTKASDYVQVAGHDMFIAKNYRQRALEKNFIFFLILVVVITVFLLVFLLGFFTHRKFRFG